MAYTFLKAQGRTIGSSLCEEDFLEKAAQLLEHAKEAGCEVFLPTDHVVTQKIKENAEYLTVVGDIDDDWMGVDIGPQTRKQFAQTLSDAKTVVWNGPMGVFETKPFDEGTQAVAQAVAQATEHGARTVIGGGDSASAIKILGLADKVTHISTGGGAFLEYVQGEKLPAVEILEARA